MSYYNQFALSIKGGDEKTFEIFFKMEFDNIVHFVNSYLNNELVAQDIAQETFISFWNKRDYINESLNIRSYLFKIARNKTLNYIRDNHMANAVPAKEYLMDFYALSDEVITQKIDALQLEDLINKTYSNLPPDIKQIFYMNRVHGFTYAQIAEQKHIPVKAVEYQIKKALLIFRKKLKSHMASFFTLAIMASALFF
jgi:RNA polymerase sigma-70 factor (ECF subfamily)